MATFDSYRDFIHNYHEFCISNINTFEEDVWPAGAYVWLRLESGVEYDPVDDLAYADGDQLIWRVVPYMWDGTVEDGYRILKYRYEVDGKPVTAIELDRLIRERMEVLRNRRLADE